MRGNIGEGISITYTTYGIAVDRAVVSRLRDYIAQLEAAFDQGQRAVMLTEILGSLTDLLEPGPVSSA